MTPERWQEVKKVLAGALERTPEERSVYLDQACADPDLRRAVETLIVAHEQGDTSSMEQPILDSSHLQIGAKLGPYTIVAHIGAGGMGEVYRAHDANLRREVAIKVLPRAFVNHPDRLARFQREARMLASLNHPNIAAIYGLEESGSTRALVMELAEGPTLADRIRQGPIPIEEALPIAKQMADGIEYAHERGIIHRDLKPANVKVASDDTVKILDFGLAKAMETDLSADDIANSPTISQMATEAGVLLGTAAYMSPEQAKAKPVDRRADIWAFGCVLYEMLTGKMAFRGESVTETLAAVIRAEPDWSQLPAATPPHVRVLLHRCLQKDAKQRLRDIGDARISLEEVLSGAPEASLAATGPAVSQTWLSPSVAAVCLLMAIAGWVAFLYFRPKPPAGQAMRFEFPMPEKVTVGGGLALSPDGSKLAFMGRGVDGQTRVWVRSLKTLEAQPLDGTEGAMGLPFWSPDSRFIAFPTPGKLKKIESAGGLPLTLCDTPLVFGGAWSGDKIVFGTVDGLLQVSASGGSPIPLTAGGLDGVPFFLPDGRHFVYLYASDQVGSGTGIFLGSVDTKPQDQPSKKLLGDYSAPVYMPSSDPAFGYLLFVRGAMAPGAYGSLMAQQFDTRRMELTGDAVSISEKVPNMTFSASATDVLVYLTGPQPVAAGGVGGIIWRPGQLTWLDRQGKVLGTIGDVGLYGNLALSLDEKRVAFERSDPQNSGNRNIWLYEFARGVATRFTFDSSWDSNPVWSPDSSRVAFGSSRAGVLDLYQKTSNLGSEEEVLFKSGESKLPSSWSPDGRSLLYFSAWPPNHLWLLPLGGAGADRKPVRVERSEFNQAMGRFSPDGRWIAYSSDESGRNEIYVRPFDASFAAGSSSAGGTPITGKWMVSKDGGYNPLWRRDGKELFYLSLVGTAMAVDVNTSGVFQAGVPKVLFKLPPGVPSWDVSADGRRFLTVVPTASGAQSKFTVVLNWQAALKK
jgi:Tol biopolymer transport system component